jgi:hypothetical protein
MQWHCFSARLSILSVQQCHWWVITSNKGVSRKPRRDSRKAKKGKAHQLPRHKITLHPKQKASPNKKKIVAPAAKRIWKESDDGEEEDDKDSDEQEEFGGSKTDGSNLEDRNCHAAKKRQIEELDYDSYIKIAPKLGEKPLFDLTTDELVAMSDTPKVCKHTNFMMAMRVANSSSDPEPRKVHAIQPGVQWWNGIQMPKIPGFGETNPVYATTYYVASVPEAIDDFVNELLEHPGKKKPAAHQWDYATCKSYVNECLGCPETSEDLDV